MVFFWILWSFNALMALIPIYFYFAGLADGTVNAKNGWMWLIILLIVAIVVGGSLYLISVNQLSLSKALLILASIPGVLAVLYFTVIMTSNTRWN